MSDTPIYIEVAVKVQPLEPFRDIFIAQLGTLGFESFSETAEGFEAYIIKEDYDEAAVKEALIWEGVQTSFVTQEIEQINWNAEWEKSFNPIEVKDKVNIRAPFHDPKDFSYEIIIEPKMSFGTGHHETTHLMIEHLLDMDLTGKKVLDMGTGTGILAIFSEMKGAEAVDAIDIDLWSFENTIENAERNNCKYIHAEHGGVELIEGRSYDVVIANINRNILLQDMQQYIATLMKGGNLLLSGFYSSDLQMIRDSAEEYGMVYESVLVRNDWNAVRFRKA